MTVEPYRIRLKWYDQRYIEGNEGRITGCKSNHVVWTEANQFWLPNFYVWNVRELVSSNSDKVEGEMEEAIHIPGRMVTSVSKTGLGRPATDTFTTTQCTECSSYSPCLMQRSSATWTSVSIRSTLRAQFNRLTEILTKILTKNPSKSYNK